MALVLIPDQPKTKVKTEYFTSFIDTETANQYYLFLKGNVHWVDGIYSRKARGPTRLAFATNDNQTGFVDEFVSQIVHGVLKRLDRKYNLLGSYLNYYVNGNHYCPSHRHIDNIQLVISLGATRSLKIGSKIYTLKSGDVIIFGSSAHEVPIEPNVTEGRISIATFMTE